MDNRWRRSAGGQLINDAVQCQVLEHGGRSFTHMYSEPFCTPTSVMDLALGRAAPSFFFFPLFSSVALFRVEETTNPPTS